MCVCVCIYIYIYKIHKRKKKTQLEEIINRTDSDMARMLELSAWEFKTTMIDLIRAFMDKVDSTRTNGQYKQ